MPGRGREVQVESPTSLTTENERKHPVYSQIDGICPTLGRLLMQPFGGFDSSVRMSLAARGASTSLADGAQHVPDQQVRSTLC